MTLPRFDVVPEPERELTMQAGVFATIVQIAAKLSYEEGRKDQARENAQVDAREVITDVLRQLYAEPSETSYGRGQRVALRRVAAKFNIELAVTPPREEQP